MKPNVDAIKNLISDKFQNNQTTFAKEIGVKRSHISHILKTGNCAGAQFFGGLISYCKRNELDFENYIFLPDDVNKVNESA